MTDARFIFWLFAHLPASPNPLIPEGAIRYNAHTPKKRAIHAIVVACGLLRRASGLLGLRSICALTQRVFGSVQSGFNEIAFRCAGPDRAARSRRYLQIELSLRQKWSCGTDGALLIAR